MKKLLSILIALLVIAMLPVIAFASDETVTVLNPQIFYYNKYETFNQIRITGIDLFNVWEDYTGKCAIPSEIEGIPVTSIEYEALARLDLSDVDLIIPQSVSWIDGYSFIGTNAKSVTILNPECKIQNQEVFNTCTTIIAYPNSDIFTYAQNHNLNFKCIDHIWNVSYTIDKNATCAEDGSKSIHCTACDEIKDVTTINAKGHSWDTSEQNDRTCLTCGYSEKEGILINNNRNKLYEQICAQSDDGTSSASFGNLTSDGYNYYFEVNENSFFAQYKTKDSSWVKYINFQYDYATNRVTSNFGQSGSDLFYAATATFNASDYIDVGSIVYKDATGSDYGGMCVTYAEKLAKIAIPNINQKMINEFGVSLCKIGFTSYSHTHFGGEATCCSYAVCVVCDKEYGSLEEHVTEIVNQIFATCYESGYTGDLVCTVCNEVIEYGESIPIIEREAATGKFDLLKQCILDHGKTDEADNKYIDYSDIIYDAKNNPIKVYAKITYLDEYAKFGLLYTSGENEDVTSIMMDIDENGSDVTVVEFVYEDLGLYADASVNVSNYKSSSNVYFEKNGDFILSNEQIQSLCNSELKSAFVTWDIVLFEHLQLDMNMGNMGFVSYETPATHTWSNATCKSPKTCTVCKITTGNPSAHLYSDGVDGTCNACGIHRETTEDRTVMHMFRMYDPNSGEHFYTGSMEERENLVAAGWNYEGVGFTFSRTTGLPVYRLYDPITGEHLYTMQEPVKTGTQYEGKDLYECEGRIWLYEGIAFNSAYDTEVPQYRLRNPNATRGAYHFTSSAEERNNLISAGWIAEGICFYSSWK